MPLLPAFAHLVLTAGRTARRFPLPLLCAGALCVAGCYTVRYSNQQTAQAGWIFPLLSASALGLPLTLALSLVAERYGWPRLVRWATLAGALALLAGWYALAPALPTVVWWMRLLVLLLGLHLLVAAAPYLAELRRDADTPGFWRYNETLLLRLLTGGLYTGVLYAGSALALVAVRELFGVYFEGDVFGYLLVVLTTLFNTWFFLAGVPADVAALEQPAPYPRGLQLFAQFVLLPLVTLYVVILYVYLLRIVLRWELPQGWVAVLILALAVAGIFALLLIHPLRHRLDQAWMRAFARWFYRALFPLLGLLAVAIGTRIQAYGLTEERYYVVLLAAWLLGMAGYFLWRRGQGILWVPVTLAALAFLSVAGPWSAFALAERSQLRQLRILTEQHHLLRGGRLDGAARRAPDLPRRVHGRLASIFAFFAERDALARLQPQFAGSLQLPDSLRTADPWLQADWRLSRPFELSGFERLESYELQYALNEEPERQSIRLYVSEPPRYYSLGPGQYWLRDIGASAGLADTTGSVTLELTVPEGHFRLLTSAAGDSVLLQQQQPAGPWRTQLYLPLQAPVDSLVRRYGRNRIRDVDLPAPVVLQARAQRVQLRLFVTALTRERTDSVDRYAYSAEGMLRIQP